MRFRPLALLVSSMVVASSACSMDATGPSSLTAPDRAAAARGNGGSAWSGQVQHRDPFAYASPATYTVTINPRQANLLRFGPHVLDIPASAICDARSGYGLPSFDLGCKAERKRVTITAILRSTESGVPRIDLYPAIRFNPTQVVTLRLYVPNLPDASSIPRILYCPAHTANQCIDEAELDPTLATQVDYQSSTLFRRIKHFSGYFVEW